MGLSNELISQFVKATNDNSKVKAEKTVYGTTVVDNGVTYVKLDGSEQLTPISTAADTKAGDRVIVMVKNHTATIIGNITSPSARSSDVAGVKDAVDRITELEIVISDKVSTKDFDAEKGRIDNLQADNVLIHESLTAAESNITDLKTDNVDVKKRLTANEAEIESLKTKKLDAETASITYATIDNLDATNTSIHNLESTFGDFKKLTADELAAHDASIKDLKANIITSDSIEGKFANIDFSNIGKAAMEYFYANSGLIKDVVVGNSTITGHLTGVTISGDLIEGNTIVAEKLVVLGTDGLYYKLNTDGMKTEAEQTEYNSLHGDIFIKKSISASKISVEDLVAFDATIGGFNITNKSLYSGAKESATNTTRGVYLDSNGQVSFGDATNYLKYYKDSDGEYKLDISASNIMLSSNNKSVETVLIDSSEAIITAQSTADDAKTDAAKAQSDANALAVRMASAETQIGQNSDSIALRATKTEVTKVANDLANNYYTKTQADSALVVKADEITSNVSSTYATKSALSTTDSNIAKAQKEIDAVGVRVGSAETKISQNTNDINLRATKTELNTAKSEAISTAASDATTKANGALTSAKSYADAQIKVSADSITSTVNSIKTTADTANSYVTNAKNNYGYQYKKTITIYGGSSTYYPVLILGGDQNVMREIMVKRAYSDKAPADWNGHPTLHGISLLVKLKCNFGGWGGANYSWYIHELEEMYGNVFAGASRVMDNMGFVVFLRGGGETGALYHIFSDQPLDREYMNGTSVRICYDQDKIGWSGGTEDNPTYSWKAPTPRTYTDSVKKEIASKKYIDLAVSAQNGVDSLTQRVSTAETKINQNSDAIELRATKSELTTVDTKATNAQSTANTANSTANNTKTNLANNYYTKTQTDAKVKVESDKISSAVTRIGNNETAISTLEQTADGLTTRLNTTDSNVTTAQNSANTAKTNAANAAKTATNYLGFSSAGLVVGDMTASTLGKNVLIDSDSVDIRNGTTTLASFGADNIYIGKNSSTAVINLCNGSATMRTVDNKDFKIYTDKRLVMSAYASMLLDCYRDSTHMTRVSLQSSDPNTASTIGNVGVTIYQGTIKNTLSMSKNNIELKVVNSSTESKVCLDENIFKVYANNIIRLNSKNAIQVGESSTYSAGILLGNSATVNKNICCYWNDGSIHDLLNHLNNGQTSYLGPGDIGKTTYTNIRGQNVRLYAHSGGGVYLGYSGSTAVTSDKNLKKDIADIDSKYIDFFDRLRAVTYKYDAPGNRGHRDHIGFVAQEVEQALTESGLTTEQFAGLIIENNVTLNPNYDSSLTDEENEANSEHYDTLYSLRYEEFISLLVKKVQSLQEQINQMKQIS